MLRPEEAHVRHRTAGPEITIRGADNHRPDIDGNIGYQTTGKVPIRAAGDGSLPVELAGNVFALISNDGHTLRLACPHSLESKRPVGCRVEFLRLSAV